MRIIRHTQKNFPSVLRRLDRRSAPPEGVEETVRGVIDSVREKGDRALLDLTARFDGASFSSAAELRVSEAEFAEAEKAVDAETKKAVAASRRNVTRFARRSLRKDWSGKNDQGAEVGEIFQPFERVGIYVPGGSAPLVSSANMTVALAAAAGCPEIVVATPPGPDGSVHPALLHALRRAGATEVYKLGGAQAIAGLSVGTKTIPPVVKIFGPGNSYVVEAKRQLFGTVAVDLLPGPSEVVVLADKSGRADCIAADLLAQAEHGGDSGMGLITDSEELLDEVRDEVREQVKTLGRQKQLRASLKQGGWLMLVESMDQGAEVVNRYAPEHLSLVTRREKTLLPKIRTAGAIFLGNWSPVAVGDFLAGPSHELPTGGAGKSFPGLTVDMFQRRTSVVRLDRSSLAKSVPVVEAFAEAEGLDAHGRSASIRLRK